MKKRIVSLLLAVVMVVSLLPVTALAADDITFGDLYGLIGEQKFVNSSNIVLSFAGSDSIIIIRFDASSFVMMPKNTNVSVTSNGYQLNIGTHDGANNIFDFYVSDHALTKVVVSGMVKTERNDEYYPYHPVADYAAVMAAVEQYKDLDAADYTSGSWEALQDAVDRVIYDLDADRQADVDAMAKAIMDAIDSLEVSHTTHDFTGDCRDNGDGTHARKCTGCDEYSTPEAHSFTNGVCVCGAVESPAPAAPVPYLFYTADSNGVLTPVTKECETYEAVDSTTTVFDDGGWYVADGEITVGDRITVNSGTANLILKDGAKLTAQAGINVAEGSTLNIYAQSEGAAMGQLAAVGSDKVYTAGIGGGNKQSGGTVNIYGGTVSATGGWMSAGIGGGFKYSKGGSVTIYNGVVTVRGGHSAAGIGGGDGGDGGNVAIYGGTVTAIGDKYCPGIGSGFNGRNDGTLTLGRYVHFEAGDSAEKIDENATKDNFSKYDYVHTTTSDVALYEVTVDSSIKNGTVTVDKSACASGETVTLTATPTDGYELDSWNVTDKNGGPVTVNSQNQFTMPESDVTVSAAFISGLDAAKEAAKKAIDDALPADASDEVKAAAEKAKAAIDAAGSVEDVDAAAEAGTEAIEKQIAGEEAAEQKALYQKKITDKLLPAAKCDEAREILKQALADLDNAETVSDMDSIMNNAEEAASDKENEFSDWCLESSLYFKDALTDASSDETKAFVAELEQALADATSIAQVKDIFNNNKSTIDFYSSKDNAIAYLNEYISSDEASEEMKALARECLSRVKNAATVDEFKAITDEFEPQLEFQKTKDDFLAECNGMLASDEYSEEMKSLIREIIGEIKAAETADECNAVMQKYDSALLLQFEKDDARKEIRKLLPDNASDAVKKIISDACAEIQANDDPDEYAEIIEAAGKAVEAQLQKDEELAPVKEAAKKAIDDALPADASDAVKAAAEKAKEAIDAATTTDAVNTAKENGLTTIADQIAAEELAAAKEKMIDFLEEKLNSDVYSDDYKAIVQEAMDAVKAADSMEALNAIPGEYQPKLNLQENKDGACQAIDSAVPTDASDAVKAIADAAKAAIKAATTDDEVETAVDNGLDAIEAQLAADELAKAKEELIADCEEILKSDEYSDDYKAIVEEILDAAKAADSMEDLDAIEKEYSPKLDLQLDKDEACAAIQELLPDDASDAVKKIAGDACDKIQASDDSTGFDSFVNETRQAIEAQLQKEAELADAKEAAKKAIDDAVPADASDAVKAAAEKAKEAIDAANSAEDVEAAKEAGTEAVKKQIADEEAAVKEKAQFKETITNTLLPAAKCDEAREILKQALADLDNAVTRDDVNQIFNNALGAANGKDSEFEGKRSGYTNAFNSALTQTSSDETKEFVAEMKQALADATSIAQVEEIFNSNNDRISFCLTKDGYLNGLSGSIDSDEYSDAWKAIAREYYDQIKTASTMDELNAIRDKFSPMLELQSKKDEAYKKLEKLLSDDASYAEKKIISDACAEIQANDDPTKYDAIVEEANKAVEAWHEKEAEHPAVKDFVLRFYSVCLDRTPGDEELGYYQWEIIDNGMTGSEVAGKFIFSDEFCMKNYCDRHYVEALYKTFMGRVPGDDEVGHWVWQLQQGMTREQVFNSFLSSAEFASFCTEAGIKQGSTIVFEGKGTRAGGRCTVDGCKSADGLDRFVKRLYNVTLDRDPAQDELDAWVYFLIHGDHTAKTASHEFLFSEEFISRGYDDEVFADYLYRAMMGRTPGADEVEYWVWRFSTGLTREAAFDEFADSHEFALLCQDYGINCR